MNKLFTKIAAACVTAAMAVGVGVAISTMPKSIMVSAAGGSDTLDSSKINLSGTGSTAWATGNFSATTSGATYSYRLMGSKSTTDGRMGGTNANGGVWTTVSGGILNSVTVTTTTAKALALYGGTSPFTAYNDTSGRASLGSKTTSGSGTTFTASWTNLSSGGYTHVLLKGTASSTFIKSIVYTWNAPSSDPTITLGNDELYVTTATEKTLSVDYANLTANITVSQSGSGTVQLSTDGTNYSTSLTLDKSITAPQTIHIKGDTAGTATLSFASTGATTKTCTVHVDTPTIYKKVTQNSKMKDGGKFALLATGTSIAMSKTQLTNGRDPVNVDLVDNDIYLPSKHDVAILTITQGTGTYADYYTIFDPAYSTNGGYLEYYNSNLTCYYVSTTPTTDAFYWSISFHDNHVRLENKANVGNYIEYNSASNAKYFRLYAGTQTKIDLFELESDIPSSVDLTSITATDVTVGQGSTIHYSGTYLPANATELIEGSLGTAIATLGEIEMSNGNFTLTIQGNTAGSTTLSFSGADGHGSASVTLTVSSYAATHSLVTSVSSLINGRKVVFGTSAADAENADYSSAAHTGGNFVPTAPTAYASDRSTLAAGEETVEYTLWCVDTTNNYYVFSHGGYYLCAPSSANNYLQRTDVLSERCYFTITDGEAGVLVTSQFSVSEAWANTYTIQYNYNSGTNPRFSLYKEGTQTAASLYISNESVDAVQGFVDVFMHLDNYTTDKDYCKDEDHHYYSDAKAAYNGLSSAQKLAFCTESAYATAYERLCHWAFANGDTIDANYELSTASIASIFAMNAETSTAVIVIIAVTSITTIGAIFFIKRRKYN